MLENEFKNNMVALLVRYNSLRAGETLGKLTSDEQRELFCLETGHGLCVRLNPAERHELIGFRSACESL